MNEVTRILWVGFGGFCGAIARYLLGGWIAARFGPQFPWGTLVINLSGSFILGVVATLLAERLVAPPQVRLFIAIGFLGAYTTFSTFTYETLALWENGSYLRAAANIFGSLLAGLLAVWLGVRWARG
jgi:CrcB protein